MKSLTTQSLAFVCISALALPAVFAGSVDDKFKKMDTDSNGQISREEHAAGARMMFIQIDSNTDGVVTAAEMAVKKDSKADSSSRESNSSRGDTKADEMAAADKIKLIDQNGDGQLTQAEHDAGSATMFTKLDTSGDGQLSQKELEAGHKTMKKQK